MDIHQIRKLVWLGGGLLLVLLIISYAINHRSSNPLAKHTFTDSISGTTESFYADKGLEVQSNSPTFVNADALNVLGDSKATDTLTALKQFVNAQSHLTSRAPVITDLQKNKAGGYDFSLFLDSSEVFYDVDLRFSTQQIPILSYMVDDHAKI